MYNSNPKIERKRKKKKNLKKVWSIDETIGYGHQNLKHWNFGYLGMFENEKVKT